MVTAWSLPDSMYMLTVLHDGDHDADEHRHHQQRVQHAQQLGRLYLILGLGVEADEDEESDGDEVDLEAIV